MSDIDLHTSSDTIYRLPRSHWHCHFSNFEWGTVQPSGLLEQMETFLESVAAGRDTHLLLAGRPGIGKTHLGVAAYRWMADRVGTTLTTWVNVPTFCDHIKQSYNDSEYDPLLDYADARALVVLDDLFGRTLTEYEANQIIVRLLDIAYQNGAAMLITMNRSIEELPQRLHPHEISRLLTHATIISMQGHDHRRSI